MIVVTLKTRDGDLKMDCIRKEDLMGQSVNGRKILFQIDECTYKGYVKWDGHYVPDNLHVFGVELEMCIDGGTDGNCLNGTLFQCKTQCGVLINSSIDNMEIDVTEYGFIKNPQSYKFVQKDGDHPLYSFVSITRHDNLEGVIVRSGLFNNIFCYGIKFNEKIEGCDLFCDSYIVRKHDVNIKYTWIQDLNERGIHTYMKVHSEVIPENETCAHKIYGYLLDNENKKLHYLIKLDNEQFLHVAADKAKCVVPMDKNKGAFVKIENLEEYGIISKWNYKSVVKIIRLPDGSVLDHPRYGDIVWIGFDLDRTLKFGVELETEYDTGTDNGCHFSERLYNVRNKCGMFVTEDCLADDDRFDSHNGENRPKMETSEIIDQHIDHLFQFEVGDYRGIQGNLNSCYLDTSFFSMFTFTELFDTILECEQTDKEKNELQRILRSHIIYPLRSKGYVDYEKVENFRKCFSNIIKDNTFLMREKDPEELLEPLFSFIIPKKPFLRTIKNDKIQPCFLIQIFFGEEHKEPEMDIGKMLTLSFLEEEMFIENPPKCLVLQLPRHGTHFKNYQTVKVNGKLDVTKLIASCEHTCCKCKSKPAQFYCQECSRTKKDYIYYCDACKDNCKHIIIPIPKSTIKSSNGKSTVFSGPIILDLIAVLCIERTHYVAFVKTGEVNENWLYFNSMERMENKWFIPHVRNTKLHEYFQDNEGLNEADEDVMRIKNHAFVCFYRNPLMAFYEKDFNEIV